MSKKQPNMQRRRKPTYEELEAENKRLRRAMRERAVHDTPAAPQSARDEFYVKAIQMLAKRQNTTLHFVDSADDTAKGIREAYSESELRRAEDAAAQRGFIIGSKFAQALSDIRMALLHIDGKIASIRREEALRKALAGEDGVLSKVFTDFIGARRKLKVEPRSADHDQRLSKHIAKRTNAIQAFNAQEIGIDELRDVVREWSYDQVLKLMDITDNINLGGNKPGMQPWRRDLAEAWIALESEYRRVEGEQPTALRVVNQLKRDLLTDNKKPKPGLNPRQQKQANSIAKVKGPRKASDYRYRLITDYEQS
jgi:hypothetical protein